MISAHVCPTHEAHGTKVRHDVGVLRIVSNRAGADVSHPVKPILAEVTR